MSIEIVYRDIEHIQQQQETMWAHIHSNAAAIADTALIVESVRTDLVGTTGNNGLRSEVREYRREARQREERIMVSIEKLDKKYVSSTRWLIGLFFSTVGLIITLLSTGGIPA